MADNKTITVTSPLLPDLKEFEKMLEDIWQRKWLTNNGYYHKELEKALPEVDLFVGVDEYNNLWEKISNLINLSNFLKNHTKKNEIEKFDNNKNYCKAIRFAGADLKNELKGYITFINNRKAEEKRRQEEDTFHILQR